MIITPNNLRNASDLVELIRLVSTAEGLETALAQVTAAKTDMDQREADILAREQSIEDRLRQAGEAEDASLAALSAADQRKAEADAAMEALTQATAALDEREVALKAEAKALRARDRELDKREKEAAQIAEAQDARDAVLDAREQSLDARTVELTEKEQRLRAALEG